MTLPSSLQAYQDCYDFFDKILDDPVGGRVYRGTETEAFNWRQRCHYFRKLDREQNRITKDPEDPMYGKSVFDVFQLTLKQDFQGGWWVYAKKLAIPEHDIQRLSEIDDSVEEPSDGQAAE